MGSKHKCDHKPTGVVQRAAVRGMLLVWYKCDGCGDTYADTVAE